MGPAPPRARPTALRLTRRTVLVVGLALLAACGDDTTQLRAQDAEVTTPVESAPPTVALEPTDAGWHVVAGDPDGALTLVRITWDDGTTSDLTYELGRWCPDQTSAMDVVLAPDGRTAVSATATSTACDGTAEQQAAWP